MSSFYSIVHAGINPVAGDKLAVGLFMRGAQGPRFAWSRNRVGVVRDLLGRDAHRMLVVNLKALARETQADAKFSAGLFSQVEAGELAGQLLQEPYFEYLSRYSRNLLTFGPVTRIEVEADEARFAALFKLLVDDHEPSSKPATSDIDEVREGLRARTAQRLAWEVTLTQARLPGLLMPAVTIGFHGRNELDVIGEVVDFERPNYHLENQLYELNDVQRAISANKQLGKAYVVGDEPDANTHAKQHATWKAFRAQSRYTVVPSNEVKEVENYMEEHNVRPVELNETVQ
ncbi:MAG: hypothetical protein IPM49_15580 [Flavobacteriales bacterium]|nr:hypothetical protein [Flavobacteriales bacterium]